MASLTVSYQNNSCAWINAFTASPNNGYVRLSESIYMHLKIEDRPAMTHKIKIIFSRLAEHAPPLLQLALRERPFKEIKPITEINQKEIKETYTFDLNKTTDLWLLLKVTASHQANLKDKTTVMTIECAGQRLLRRFVKQEGPKFARTSKNNPTGFYRQSPLAINHCCQLGSSDFLTTTPLKSKSHPPPSLPPPPPKIFKSTLSKENPLFLPNPGPTSLRPMPQIPTKALSSFDPTLPHAAGENNVHLVPKTIWTDLFPTQQEEDDYAYLARFFTLPDLP